MKLAFLAAVLAAGAVPQDDLPKKIVPEAEKVKKLAKKISPQARDKIEKALGEKLDAADLTPALWECYCTVPKVSSAEKSRCVMTAVTVKGPKGAVKVGVASVLDQKTIHAVRILENQDDKALESKFFLGQFSGLEYADLYQPPVVLADGLKKAEGADEAAKEQASVVTLCATMHSMGPAWERMMDRLDKKDKAAADDWALLDKGIDDSLKILPAARFFKATKQEKYKGFATGAKSDLADLKKMIDAGKLEEAYRRSSQIESERCAKCHASYRMEFRKAREDRNLANGHFSTKLEVASPDPRLEASYQAVAAGVRKAILLATEAR